MTERYADYYQFEPPGVPQVLRLLRDQRGLPEVVLDDLKKATSQEEKLSILEDFDLACQRRFRNRMISDTSSKISTGLEGLISNIAGRFIPFLVEQEMPKPTRIFRAGKGKPQQDKDSQFKTVDPA